MRHSQAHVRECRSAGDHHHLRTESGKTTLINAVLKTLRAKSVEIAPHGDRARGDDVGQHLPRPEIIGTAALLELREGTVIGDEVDGGRMQPYPPDYVVAYDGPLRRAPRSKGSGR